MLADRIARTLLRAPALATARTLLAAGEDAQVAVAPSGRPLTLVALFAERPRPTLCVVASEEEADRVARALTPWLGADRVLRYRDRADLPWQDKAADLAVVGERCRAVEALARGEAVVVVCAARSLLRKVPPKGVPYFREVAFALGDVIEPSEAAERLLAAGYVSADEAAEPGTFGLRGDILDVFPAQANHPARIEFFGDEIDRVREMVAATGQTIADALEVRCAPAREFALTDATVASAERALKRRAQDCREVAAALESIRARIPTRTTDLHLEALYGSTGLMTDHIAEDSLVVLFEPRALFDDCLRRTEELEMRAREAGVRLETVFAGPRELDFGGCRQLSLASIREGARRADPTELRSRQPQISGADSRLLNSVRAFTARGYQCLFCVPDRPAREHLMLTLTDEAIPIASSLIGDPANEAPLGETSLDPSPALDAGVVTFSDLDIPQGAIFPEVGLAVLSVADLTRRLAKGRRAASVDPTQVTFPFKPGDYVVHETFGIARFAEIERLEVDGRERDYFLLEYAAGDLLHVPLELVGRLTRYIGPDGSEPRVTRLHSADWARVTGKARANAKKLAFDLVDLYARRAEARGHAFGPDTPEQLAMEASFPYELTGDQLSAIADIKEDMEQPKPMDRLLCGDVGFGKTEVALRAAFKAVQEGRQVMVLCPTTILASQHLETFRDRFEPFDVRVEVLSRFRTAKQQRETLAAFAAGDVDVLIGTHRLLSADVNPKNLGLVVVDEEQRFGVGHKEQLKNIREQVDVLTLSATPIPRTMQMALSGVRDMSLIMEAPPGRLPVKVVVGEWSEDTVSAAIRAEVARGGQVYYVSNRVADIDEALARVQEAAPEARVGVAHGKMSPKAVEEVMLAFAEREIDVLVATTIIESGIDNPHTNTLIIEDSQRLGLAQLYQLKGRVGRGRVQAYAYFLFPGEVPLTDEALERLVAIGEFQELGSGLRIAMRDLEIRGAGSLLGAEQHGNLSNVGFDLFTQMIGEAVAEARGEVEEAEPPEVAVNIPADFYFSEDYLPEVDRRVLAYRRLANARTLADVDALEAELEERYGALEEAGMNLLDRQRIRVRGERLGVRTITLAGGRLTFEGLRPSPEAAAELREGVPLVGGDAGDEGAEGPRSRVPTKAVIYPKSAKVTYPCSRASGNPIRLALAVLELCGGDDE